MTSIVQGAAVKAQAAIDGETIGRVCSPPLPFGGGSAFIQRRGDLLRMDFLSFGFVSFPFSFHSMSSFFLPYQVIPYRPSPSHHVIPYCPTQSHASFYR